MTLRLTVSTTGSVGTVKDTDTVGSSTPSFVEDAGKMV